MVEEKPIYVGVYCGLQRRVVIYSLVVGANLPSRYSGNLVGKIRVPKKYLPIVEEHLKNERTRLLGNIWCVYENTEKTSMKIIKNEPLFNLDTNTFDLAKNTGFGSYLLLAVAADLKKKGAQLIRSEVSLSFEGKGQLRKAELEHHKKYNINDWQRGIAKNVRFAKRRLI